MENLSFEAVHLLRAMRSSGGTMTLPLRGVKEQVAMEQLHNEELVALTEGAWRVTSLGYGQPLTKL